MPLSGSFFILKLTFNTRFKSLAVCESTGFFSRKNMTSIEALHLKLNDIQFGNQMSSLSQTQDLDITKGYICLPYAHLSNIVL